MLGKRSGQRGLFEADHLYLDYVGRHTFYGFLATQRGQLFRDDEFAELYCADNGRNSVPPSLIATALLLQAHDRVSDQEAKARADFDLRWKVALGIGMDERPFAKSTLQLFRAQLVLHDKVRAVFQRSLQFARQTGYLKNYRIRVALDTTNILGRGAVKDTYNLLADGIKKLLRVLAALEGVTPEEWARANDLSRYLGSSIKGEAVVDWDDQAACRVFLNGIVADADRLLETARRARGQYPAGSAEAERIAQAAGLLGQLLLQDVERREDGAAIKAGVARGRIPSVHDPEMRHGRKSASKCFDGHKAALAVDIDSQLITAAVVLPGNARDNEQALGLVEETERNTEAQVEETLGDCAYGDGGTRQQFADAGRVLVARVPGRKKGGHIPKEDFRIDLDGGKCTCPEGQVCTTMVNQGKVRGRIGREYAVRGFRFAPHVCGACPRRGACVAGARGKGRTVRIHPQERLLQDARALQGSPAFAVYRAGRQVAEHRLARLVQLGIRQARYFGRVKTLFQLLMAAAVANLTLVATKMGYMQARVRGIESHPSFLAQIWAIPRVIHGHLVLLQKRFFGANPVSLRVAA